MARFSISCPYSDFTSDQKRAYEELYTYFYYDGKRQVGDYLDELVIPDLANIILSYVGEKDLIKTSYPLCLLGSAGTGKTYLVSMLLHDLAKNTNHNIYVLAPTHKARHNLSHAFNKEEQTTLNVHFRTLASFLKMTMEYEPSGNSYFVSKLKSSDLEELGPTHIFIDEVSMIKNGEWEDIQKHIIRVLPECKIVLVGDDHQLPPVTEKKSVVFEEVKRKIVLNEIVRTDKSEMLKMYRGLRHFVHGKTDRFPFDVYRSGEVMLLPTVLESILKIAFDPTHDKIIAYRNKTVEHYNKLVRKVLYNDPDEEIVRGERLMFQHYYVASDGGMFYPSYEFTVDEVRIVYKKVGRVECKFYEFRNRDQIFRKIHPEHRDFFEGYFSELKMKIKRMIQKKIYNKKEVSDMWKDFYQKKSHLDVPVTYAYALTVHKSQGSTYRKVFLDVQDLECLRFIDLQQYKYALYTAGTRASERIRLKV